MDKRRYNGAIQSPKDGRDYKILQCMDIPAGGALYPDNLKVWIPEEVKDQGNVQSCTAFAMSAILECIEYKLYGRKENFSVGFLYGNRRQSDWKGEGCIMRDVPKTVQKYGNVYNTVYEDLSEVSKVIDNFEKNYASCSMHSKKLVKNYIRIDTEQEAKSFLYKYNVPLFVSTRMKYINPLTKSEGLHAMAAYGYDKKYFYCLNSWGKYNCEHPKIKFENFTEVWGIVPMEKEKFKDIEDSYWAKDIIENLAEKRIVNGFADNTFRPEKQLTRAEYCASVYNLLKYIEKNFKRE